jgi:predicted metalloendopeptidase
MGMTPPTVNAYYSQRMNDINFPAGVLQPPLYDPKMDDAPNYGDTGGTIGHELTHGFDDQGRKFDAQGNLKDWWTSQDSKNFEARAQCVVDQYAQYVVVDDDQDQQQAHRRGRHRRSRRTDSGVDGMEGPEQERAFGKPRRPHS